MTDRELDSLMRRVLLDSIKREWGEEEEPLLVFAPSARHRRQITAMLANPLGWFRKRTQPAWKTAVQWAAMLLLVVSLSFGGLMAVSPTARAAFVRWVVEWYENHIVYRHAGETISGVMPQYEITALPEGYVEDESQRIEWPTYVSIKYKNEEDETAPLIWLKYIYMQQGSVSDYVTEDADVFPVTINGMEGQLYLARNPEISDSTVTWIDPERNIQFDIDAALDKDGILHIAESVSLVKTEK